MFENKLPLSGLTVINNPVSLDIQIEKRKVKLVDSITPTANNAWVYSNVAPPGAPQPQSWITTSDLSSTCKKAQLAR